MRHHQRSRTGENGLAEVVRPARAQLRQQLPPLFPSERGRFKIGTGSAAQYR
jgi:hypothetical protein